MSITLKEIRTAYKALNLRPIRKEWADYGCACPLTVLCRYMTNNHRAGSYAILDWADNRYGQEYIKGFIRGVDGDILYETTPEQEFNKGHRRGKRIWAVISKRGVNDG